MWRRVFTALLLACFTAVFLFSVGCSTFVHNHSRVALVLREEREKLGDVAEQKLYELIRNGDLKAITFYLSTVCANRSLPQ